MKKTLCLLLFIASSAIAYSQQPTLLWEKEGFQVKPNCSVFSSGDEFFIQSTLRNEYQYSQVLQKYNSSGVIRNSKSNQYSKMVLSEDNSYLLGVRKNQYLVEIIDPFSLEIIGEKSYEHTDSSYSGLRAIAFINKQSYALWEMSYPKIQIFNLKTGLKVKDIDIGNFQYIYMFGHSICAILRSSQSLELFDMEKEERITVLYDNFSDFGISLSADKKLAAYSVLSGSKRVIKTYDIVTGITGQINVSTLSPTITIASNNTILNFDFNEATVYVHKGNTVDSQPLPELLTTYFVLSAPQLPIIIGTDAFSNIFAWNFNDFSKKYIDTRFFRGSVPVAYNATFGMSSTSYVVGTNNTIMTYANLDSARFITFVNPRNLLFSPDKSMLVVADAGKVEVFDANDLNKLKQIKMFRVGDRNIKSVVFLNSDEIALSLEGAGIIKLNIKTGDYENIQAYEKDINTLAYLPGRQILVAGGLDKKVHFLQLEGGIFKNFLSKQVDTSRLEYTKGVGGFSFTHDEKLLFASCSDWNTYEISMDNYEIIRSFHASKGKSASQINKNIVTQNKKYLITGCSYGSVRLYRLSDGREIWYDDINFTNPISNLFDINSLEISGDGKYMLLASSSGTVAMYDVESLTDVLDEFLKLNVNVYPNPAKEYFSISAPQEIEEAALYNMEGEKLMMVRLNQANYISGLPAGAYICKIRYKGKLIGVKIMKE